LITEIAFFNVLAQVFLDLLRSKGELLKLASDFPPKNRVDHFPLAAEGNRNTLE
jgi:hypothetical protein